MKSIILIILIIFSVQVFLLLVSFLRGFYKYFLINELNLVKRYGSNMWVVITGASSGQGKDFAIEFASRGFNILMIGSKRTIETEKIIHSRYPNVKTLIIYKDFRKAFENDFFNDIQDTFNKLNTDNLIVAMKNDVQIKDYDCFVH